MVESRTTSYEAQAPTIYFVIPCFNEEVVLPVTAPKFAQVLRELQDEGLVANKSKIVFVDDGSHDNTWNIIEELAATDSVFAGIKLSRNRGHQNALLAGLMEVVDYCDAAISMDCDGQDDIHAARQMVINFNAGDDIVYGVRSSRGSDTPLKRLSAERFYRLMKSMGADTVFNHADYRLMSQRALYELARYEESNLYLRGIVPLLGFPSSTVEYERTKREKGDSHYSLGKMLKLAVDGITSFTIRPLHWIAVMGFFFGLLGLVGVIWAIVQAIAGNTVAGWASIVSIVCFIGGINLLSLSVIGEYIGKIYLESKHRPRWTVEEKTGDFDA